MARRTDRTDIADIADTTAARHQGSSADNTDGTERQISVVVIDDDPDFVEALTGNLADHGFSVKQFTDSVLAHDYLVGGGECDAILLDWYMPRLNGAAFLKLLRDAGIMTPVVVMTASGNDSNEDAALGFGAIDFVEKSRRVSILVKRLRLIAGGTKSGVDAPEPDEFVIGDLSLRIKSGRALWRGREVDLTFTEFRIVQMLATKAGSDLTYREIYDVVHGEGFWAGDGETGYRVNVRSLIKRIRQKFQRIHPEFNEIENYPGYGYRWHAVTSEHPASEERNSEAGVRSSADAQSPRSAADAGRATA